MKFTLTFDDPLAGKLELSGGKGANLSLLFQRGFPVPPGFIVTVAAYRDFIAAAGHSTVAAAGFSFHDPARLKTQSEDLRAKLSVLALPPAAAEEIRRRLAEFSPAQHFSVRSSSTMEDLAGAAFAGQHDTYLNCRGADTILDRIKACFLSLWMDRAIAYRHQHGFDHAAAAMAVVVQQMVPCDVAGVGFSVNPISGDLGEMIINANFGLGESVVSGEGEVDHFTLDRASRCVRSRNIARKSRKIVGADSGTRDVQLNGEEGGRACLNDDQLRQLADLLLRVEATYQFPQDIEWGFAGRTLHLLQSRPITAIPPRWTRDESAERFPNVITPLTWDFVESGFHRSLNYSFRMMNFPLFNGKWFGMHGHYIYGNQNAVELYARRAPLTVRSLDELRAALPRLREDFRWVQDLPALWMRDLDYYLISIGQFMTEPLEARSVKDLWHYVLKVNEHGAAYFLPNIAISITHGALYALLHHLLRMVFGAEAANPFFDNLMAFCETKTGAINKELFELAALARARPQLETLLQRTSSRDIIEHRQLEPFPQFHDRLQKFLRDHGHREVDFDAYAPTWVECPWVVLDNVGVILRAPVTESPSEKERALKIRMQQAEVELFQKVPPDLHFAFAEILRLARAYTSLDDLEHYQTTRLTLPLRRGLRALGARLTERGFLSEPMDVFFARQQQIHQAVNEDTETAWRQLAAHIRRQKDDYLRDKSRTPEWVLGAATTVAPASGDCLTGLAGSPGEAEGEVFTVLSAGDFAKFPKGAVLLARTTNPTWTPLFYSAAAVITESGGPLSHGAVTAREMRIPAVMSVRESLTRLKNGRRVRVDGTRGKVFLL
jgi:pyruvate,water dikinase